MGIAHITALPHPTECIHNHPMMPFVRYVFGNQLASASLSRLSSAGRRKRPNIGARGRIGDGARSCGPFVGTFRLLFHDSDPQRAKADRCLHQTIKVPHRRATSSRPTFAIRNTFGESSTPLIQATKSKSCSSNTENRCVVYSDMTNAADVRVDMSLS